MDIDYLMSALISYKWFFELFVISATACIGLRTYQKGKKVDELNALMKIRELLQKYDDVYRFIDGESTTQGDDKKPEDSRVDEYLGILEQVYCAYKNGIISKEQVKRSYGFRLESIFKNKEVMKIITTTDEKYWRDLNDFIKEFVN